MAYSDLDSIDKMLINQEAAGLLNRCIFVVSSAATTAASSAAGYVSLTRFPATFTVPSISSTYNGYYMNGFCHSSLAGGYIAALEYDLGTLTVSGNTFASGIAMPSKTTRINGTSYTDQTASLLTVVVASATLTATTPTLTVTYTDQAGNTGNTATITVPTNAAANSGFDLTPHLNSGDTGVQSVSSMTISAGTAGTLKVKGLIPFAFISIEAAPLPSMAALLQRSIPPIVASSGETIAFYRIGNVNAGAAEYHINGVPI